MQQKLFKMTEHCIVNYYFVALCVLVKCLLVFDVCVSKDCKFNIFRSRYACITAFRLISFPLFTVFKL